MQVEQVILNLLSGYVLGAAAVVVREPGHGMEIQSLRVLGQAANDHHGNVPMMVMSFIMRCRKGVMVFSLKHQQSRCQPATPVVAGASDRDCHDTGERLKRQKTLMWIVNS